MSKTPDFEPLSEASSVLTSPNLASRSKIQPKASGRTGTKIESQARTSIAPRPGMSVRATSQVSTRATGTEMAVRTMARAKLFQSAPSAVGSASADCQLPNPYLNAWPAGATLKELVSSIPSGKTRTMPTTKGNPLEAAHPASTESLSRPGPSAARCSYSIAATCTSPRHPRVKTRQRRPDQQRQKNRRLEQVVEHPRFGAQSEDEGRKRQEQTADKRKPAQQ